MPGTQLQLKIIPFRFTRRCNKPSFIHLSAADGKKEEKYDKPVQPTYPTPTEPATTEHKNLGVLPSFSQTSLLKLLIIYIYAPHKANLLFPPLPVLPVDAGA